MDIAHGKAVLHSGVDTLGNATGEVRRRAGRMTDSAMHGMRRAGSEVSSFAQRRPVETALFGAAAACLIAGLAFWFSRRD